MNVKTREIVLADVIDNDSWRLWPAGDRSQQKDKQVRNYNHLYCMMMHFQGTVKAKMFWVFPSRCIET